MAGGTFNDQNKVLPGAYINVNAAKQKIVNADGVSGVVFTILTGMGWGVDGVVEVTANDNFRTLFGTELVSDELVGLRMVLANAAKAVVYNVNPGTKATGSVEVVPWAFEAAHNGPIGGKLKVTVGPDANSSKWVVTTILGTVVVDVQKIAKASELMPNGYIEATVKAEAIGDDGLAMLGELSEPVTVPFVGGTSKPNMDTIELIQNAIETHEFNTMVAANASDKSPMHNLLAVSSQRLRDGQGRKVQAVVPAAANTNSDYEGVIAVANTIVMDNDVELTQAQSAAFVAGATASAQPNESLTYRVIPGAKDVVPRFTDDQAIAEIEAGHMVFKAERGGVKILKDINTLHTFSDTKSPEFAKNRQMRVLDYISNTVRTTWEDNYIGKVTNNANGRDLFKGAMAEMLMGLQSSGAIEGFEVEDITVEMGKTKDSVVVTLAVTPTDAMEKLYMNVTAQ